MTPKSMRAARQELGLSAQQAATLLGVHVKTLRRWEASADMPYSRSVPPTVAVAMRWLLSGYRPPEWPLG